MVRVRKPQGIYIDLGRFDLSECLAYQSLRSDDTCMCMSKEKDATPLHPTSVRYFSSGDNGNIVSEKV